MNLYNLSFKTLCLLIGVICILFSCKNENANKDGNIPVDSAAVSDKSDKIIDKNMKYKLPSPVELYILLQSANAKFNKQALNDLNNMTKYYTRSSKAVNFGIYASDLAYCTVFGKNQETFLYFKVAKQLADDLGLTKGFNDKILKRINDNINNSDSLFEITADSYWDATSHLEKMDQTNVLPYIIIGGWIESVHIAIQSVTKYNPDNEVVSRIAEQKLLLENLVDFINSQEDSSPFKDILDKLMDIQSSYNKLDENQDVLITEEQYNEISTKVEKLRKEFVS